MPVPAAVLPVLPFPLAPDGAEVVSELGHGAFSVVYRVRRSGADYAMKVALGGRAGVLAA